MRGRTNRRVNPRPAWSEQARVSRTTEVVDATYAATTSAATALSAHTPKP